MRRILVNAGKLVIRFGIAGMVAGLFGVLVVTVASLLSMLLDPSGRQLFDGGLANPHLEFALMTWLVVGMNASIVAGLIGAFWRPFMNPWKRSLKLSILCASVAFVASLQVLLLTWYPVDLGKGDEPLLYAAAAALVLGGVSASIPLWWIHVVLGRSAKSGPSVSSLVSSDDSPKSCGQ